MRRVLFLTLVLMPLACGEDHPNRPPVVDPPAVGSISLADFATVIDTLAVTVEADRADTLFLLVDDAVVATATAASFSFRIPTTAFANGLRWLTARAANAAGQDEQLVPFLLDRLHGGTAVVVLPLSAQVDAGATQQFTAHVLGTPVKRVIWSAEPEIWSPYPGVDAGAIDTAGIYTAPRDVDSDLVVIVRATSFADHAIHGEARVEPAPAVNVKITSAPEEIVLGRPRTIEARVHGSSDPRIAWSVLEGDTHGTISLSGYYLPPATLPDPPQVTIRAASMANMAKTAEVTLGMREPYRITVSPDTATVSTGSTHKFRAEVFDAPSPEVLWSVVGGPAYGTVSIEGLYTAPPVLPTPAQARVRAHCAADTLEVADALVTLIQGPPEDEAGLLGRLFTTGRLSAIVSHQLVYGVEAAVARATAANNDSLTLTGRLTNGGGTYAYDPEPSDRLLVIPASGPTWEIVVTTFAVEPWYQDQTVMPGFFLGTLDCLVRIEGHEMHVMNSSQPPSLPSFKPQTCNASDFHRMLRGTVPLMDGSTLELDLDHRGEAWSCEGGASSDQTVAGQAVVANGFRLSLYEQLHETATGGEWNPGPLTNAWDYRLNTTGILGDREFRAPDAVIRGLIERVYPSSHTGTVARVPDWQASGTVFKNGAAYGRLAFDAPVVAGDPAPSAIVAYGFDHQVVVRDGTIIWMWDHGVKVPQF